MSAAFNQRAFSVLTVKSVDAQTRTISGMATTPETDRVGDIVDPMGANFAQELPLLWQHEHGKPIGIAKFGKATKEGIPFTATIHAEDEPGPLKELVDMAWQSIKAKLVRGVSIGFRALEYNFMKEGGIHFTKTEIYELSAVTIPANAGATITSIKTIDAANRAAAGLVDRDDERPRPASQETVVKSNPTRKPEMNTKTIGEQIANFQSTRAGFVKTQSEIMDKAAAEGLTLDADQKTNFDAAQANIDAIDDHLKRLETMEKAQASTARPATYEPSSAAPVPSSHGVTVKNTEKVEPGIGFARFARCKALGEIHHESPLQIAKSLYPSDDRLINSLTMKAPVSAANTLEAPWAGNLIADGATFADFVEWLRPQTIVGRATGFLRRLPFDVPVAIQASAGTASWVGEGAGKPVTEWTYAQTILRPLKVATIAVATREMVMRASLSVDQLIRDELARAIAERLDIDFIDPDKAAVTNISPASILNGVTPLVSSGTDADAVRCDLENILGEYADNNQTLRGAFWVMNERTAIGLALMQNAFGQPSFPGMNIGGTNTLLGLPVIVSNYAGTDSDGAIVALVNGSEIYFGDEGGIQVSVSDQASLQMDTAPTNNGITPTATSLVSLWQDNLIGWRVERFLNWQRRRTVSVVWMRVGWTACT